MTILLSDLRLAVRTLIQKPGFASIAVLTMALGKYRAQKLVRRSLGSVTTVTLTPVGENSTA